MDAYVLPTLYNYTSNHSHPAETGMLPSETYSIYPVASSYPSPLPSVIYGPPLELHAPIPLPGQNPPLLATHHDEPNINSELTFSQPPSDLPINPAYCIGGDLHQTTFPTPSELLAELAEKGIPMPSDELGSDSRSESASKARRRAMAKRVGFIPTDPDTISSHEKKRHYLESLEQYISYLHEQFSLINREHPPLERVVDYKGLSSRSIRTVLVHMENTTRELNIQTLAEEERFVHLREEILRRERNSSQ
ncbi:hypothetical protein BDN70DRAFT_876315 [Pholiota conissans]|uniref:Uncharacterized protein n=1 Tax=Pholiota conissans TaxID=109636 RepID=A0A9P6D2R8_9AGAR|nr:hypothetical protein BDN70DRAFT_876315 [Pholiota conissans]